MSWPYRGYWKNDLHLSCECCECSGAGVELEERKEKQAATTFSFFFCDKETEMYVKENRTVRKKEMKRKRNGERWTA